MVKQHASSSKMRENLLRIMTAQVRQSSRKDTLRFVKVLRKMLRIQAIRAEMVKAATRNSSTTSTTISPALQIPGDERGQ